jgi:transposase InsO family protein
MGRLSRKGNCWDNSVIEYFFLNLKMERVWRQNDSNHEEAKSNITDNIINFYTSHLLVSKKT